MDEIIEPIRSAGSELHAGLSKEQLAEFRGAVGAPLPADIEWLHRDHDGMGAAGELPMRMLSAAEVLRETAALRAVEPELLEPGAWLFWTDDNGKARHE